MKAFTRLTFYVHHARVQNARKRMACLIPLSLKVD
jgi:hypothetical protein